MYIDNKSYQSRLLDHYHLIILQVLGNLDNLGHAFKHNSVKSLNNQSGISTGAWVISISDLFPIVLKSVLLLSTNTLMNSPKHILILLMKNSSSSEDSIYRVEIYFIVDKRCARRRIFSLN
uniref:Uncharacterized protein n=1 Tax=Glossina morsitans morsitans TaxID=37546 RepID=A0A1B0F9A3_GLOMM